MSIEDTFSDILRRTKENDILGGLKKHTEQIERHLRRAAFAYADLKTQDSRKKILEEMTNYDGGDYQLEESYLRERILANYYGSMAHIFQILGTLKEGFNFTYTINSSLGGEDGASIDNLLTELESFAQRILLLEEFLIEKRFFNGFDFKEVPDYSYKQEPHWENIGFRKYFENLRQNVKQTYNRFINGRYDNILMGDYIKQKYPILDRLVQKLINANILMIKEN